jgi:hypothetical protein
MNVSCTDVQWPPTLTELMEEAANYFTNINLRLPYATSPLPKQQQKMVLAGMDAYSEALDKCEALHASEDTPSIGHVMRGAYQEVSLRQSVIEINCLVCQCRFSSIKHHLWM